MTESTLFIGAGAMGGAVLRGALTHGLLTKEQVTVTVKTESHAKALADELGVKTGTEIPSGETFGTIILGVKPQVLPTVLPQLLPRLLTSQVKLFLVQSLFAPAPHLARSHT